MTNNTVSRRSVTSGLAWSVPAVSIAAASPAMAASPAEPTCPTCLTPGNLGVYALTSAVASNRGVVAGDITANIDARQCDLTLFQPAYTVIGLSAELAMSDGRTYTSPLSVSAGAGTFGRISTFTSPVTFANVRIPNGTYSSLRAPVRPTQLTLNMTAIFIGLHPLIEISCPLSFTYDLNPSVATAGVVALGAGNVTWAGSVDAA